MQRILCQAPFVSQKVHSLDQCAVACEVSRDCERFNHCEQGGEKLFRYLSNKYNLPLENTESESEELNCARYVNRKIMLCVSRAEDVFQPGNQTGNQTLDVETTFPVKSAPLLVFLLIRAFLGATALYHCRGSVSRRFV